MNAFKLFASALTFLTKIPFPYHPSINEDEFFKNSRFFPCIGLILGLIFYISSYLFSNIFSTLMVSLIVVSFNVILTGGMHLDGVGDSFDGLFSYREKPRILEIMKDSRIGTNGILGIAFVLLFKIVAINDLITSKALIPILLMPIVGRFIIVVICYKGVNAREVGMGRTYIGNVGFGDLLIASSTLLICSVIFPMGYGIVYIIKIISSILATLIIATIIKLWIYRKIDGITGDILGLLCEVSEVVFLIIILIFI